MKLRPIPPLRPTVKIRVALRFLFAFFWLAIMPCEANELPSLRLLMFGDSLTAGYGLPSQDSLPAQLENALRNKGLAVRILNGGVSGDTTTGGRQRLSWALFDRPDGVILSLGANDGLRGIRPDITRQNLTAIVEYLQSQKIPVLLMGMVAPPNLGREYESQFNAIYPELATRYGLLFYPFILDGVAMASELNQADGIHPNAEGVAVIVERITPVLMEFVQLLIQKSPVN